jgi:GntR family transcriptional regulator
MRSVGRPALPLPLYFKVMMELQENILSGMWSPGSQIPGELELSQRLGVSVITIRQALGKLTKEGYVRRERARGTFVSWNGPSRQSVNLEVEADDLFTVTRNSTSFKLIAVEPIEPPKEITQRFRIGAKEKLTRIIRIRLSQGQPLAYVISYLPSRIGSKVREKDLTRSPLNTIIESLSHFRITEVRHTVGARLSDDEVSAHLGIPAGSPVLFIERDYLHNKETVLSSVGFYRSDLFRYELTLKRKKS